MDIILIGSGNVATALGRAVLDSPHKVLQVLGRTEEHTRKLAALLHCDWTVDPEALQQTAELYIVAVQDKAIPGLLTQLQVPEKAAIVHTAGGVSIDVFKGLFRHYGVLYPLQSLRMETVPGEDIPLLLDSNREEQKEAAETKTKAGTASTTDTKTKLWAFARDLSDRVYAADDEKRLKLHIAAVFSSNFTNYLFTLAEYFCQREQIPFEALLPLIRETVSRMGGASPAQLQTGPAARKDLGTIEKHLEVLAPYPEAKAVYRFLTEKILSTNLIS